MSLKHPVERTGAGDVLGVAVLDVDLAFRVTQVGRRRSRQARKVVAVSHVQGVANRGLAYAVRADEHRESAGKSTEICRSALLR